MSFIPWEKIWVYSGWRMRLFTQHSSHCSSPFHLPGWQSCPVPIEAQCGRDSFCHLSCSQSSNLGQWVGQNVCWGSLRRKFFPFEKRCVEGKISLFVFGFGHACVWHLELLQQPCYHHEGIMAEHPKGWQGKTVERSWVLGTIELPIQVWSILCDWLYCFSYF